MLSHPNTINETRLLRLPEVLAIFPVSRSSWYLGISKGVYPRGIKISERTVAWSAEDINKLIREVSK